MRLVRFIQRHLDEYRIRRLIITEDDIPFNLAERNAEYFLQLLFTWNATAIVARGSDRVLFAHNPS